VRPTQSFDVTIQTGFQSLDLSDDLFSDPVRQKIQIALSNRTVFD